MQQLRPPQFSPDPSWHIPNPRSAGSSLRELRELFRSPSVHDKHNKHFYFTPNRRFSERKASFECRASSNLHLPSFPYIRGALLKTSNIIGAGRSHKKKPWAAFPFRGEFATRSLFVQLCQPGNEAEQGGGIRVRRHGWIGVRQGWDCSFPGGVWSLRDSLAPGKPLRASGMLG